MDGIRLESVLKYYEFENRQHLVLDRIDLALETGKITVVLGPSGCGKTTLLRLIAGLEDFQAGRILGREDLRMSYVFQEDRLLDWLNVRDNIAFPLRSKERDWQFIDSIIDILGLADFASSYPSQLSGGMKQRVSLGRALAYRPDFILMDEPFSALDFFRRKEMQEEILRLQALEKSSILFVTHSIDEALRLGHRILILKEGQIGADYSLEDQGPERNLMDPFFLDLKERIIDDLRII